LFGIEVEQQIEVEFVGADDLESSAVLLGCDFFADEVDHDDFGEYSFEVSSGQLEDHSSLADCDYL
jgi:hypothetical protein